MKLRELRPQDAPLMLEWMHDPDVVADLKADFASKTIDDCKAFIAGAADHSSNVHFAAADDSDRYMGTVSLKHLHRDWAEFAIVVRKAAMGKGISRDAMAEILRYGVEELNLQHIYWCVSRDNTRAVRFYDKNGYQRTAEVPEELLNMYKGDSLLWYVYPG